jgi:ATP adenylyltransferase
MGGLFTNASLLTPSHSTDRMSGNQPQELTYLMERLWAPWRARYVAGKGTEGCILCSKPGEDNDASNYIVFRGSLNFVLMNLYPYNPGHLMVAPYRHVSSPDELGAEELHEHAELVSRCVKVLREAFGSPGFNTGMNIGKVAGAGIDGHIHTHVVPRWEGDANFMPVLADVRVISQGMDDIYQRLKGKL